MKKLQKHFGILGLFYVVYFCSFFNAFSQTSNKSDTQLWLDFNPSFQINNKLEYFGNLGYRTYIETANWNQIYAKPSVRWHLKNNIQIEGGLGFFYVFGQSSFNRFEITPWQGIRFKWPIYSIIEFKHIAKIEERISFLTDSWESSFDIRFRYKFESRIKFVNSEVFNKISIPLYIELFIPIGDNIDEVFSNRMRLGAGLAYKLKKQYELTFYYNWEKSRINMEDNFNLSTNAFQLKLKKVFQ